MAREIISSMLMIAPFVAPLEDVLAWQGENMQCPPEDGLRIAEHISKNVTHVVIPGLSHMLRIEEHATGFSDYGAQLRIPLASEVKGAILAWVEAQGKK